MHWITLTLGGRAKQGSIETYIAVQIPDTVVEGFHTGPSLLRYLYVYLLGLVCTLALSGF